MDDFNVSLPASPASCPQLLGDHAAAASSGGGGGRHQSSSCRMEMVGERASTEEKWNHVAVEMDPEIRGVRCRSKAGHELKPEDGL